MEELDKFPVRLPDFDPDVCETDGFKAKCAAMKTRTAPTHFCVSEKEFKALWARCEPSTQVLTHRTYYDFFNPNSEDAPLDLMPQNIWLDETDETGEWSLRVGDDPNDPNVPVVMNDREVLTDPTDIVNRLSELLDLPDSGTHDPCHLIFRGRRMTSVVTFPTVQRSLAGMPDFRFGVADLGDRRYLYGCCDPSVLKRKPSEVVEIFGLLSFRPARPPLMEYFYAYQPVLYRMVRHLDRCADMGKGCLTERSFKRYLKP